MTGQPRRHQAPDRSDAGRGNAPVVRRIIVVLIGFLVVSMAGMLALGIALYRS